MNELSVVRVERLDLRLAPRPWRFAEEHRAAIDAHFAGLCRDKPAMWNGRVLLLHQFVLSQATLSGGYVETDFASFMAWRDWGWPDHTVYNCFGMAALRAADGAFLVGVMGAHTANAGSIYFPGGTPDPTDVVDGIVDLHRNVIRELDEETGLRADDVAAEAGWHAVREGQRIALLKVLQSRLPAEQLRARVMENLAAQAEPELADMCIVRGTADFSPRMPGFVTTFLLHMWR
jgi:8-oxo-dGTP pyrophosphatase MutT (NUDIX family)